MMKCVIMPFAPPPGTYLMAVSAMFFTHFSLELQVWHGKAPSGFEDTSGLWAPFDGLDNYALPSVMKKIARFVSTKKNLIFGFPFMWFYDGSHTSFLYS